MPRRLAWTPRTRRKASRLTPLLHHDSQGGFAADAAPTSRFAGRLRGLRRSYITIRRAASRLTPLLHHDSQDGFAAYAAPTLDSQDGFAADAAPTSRFVG